MPYAQARPSDWSHWTKAQRGSWNRRNYVAKAGQRPRSLEQRALARRGRELRNRNPRHHFIHGEGVKLHARLKNRADRERRERDEARAPTVRLMAYKKANPRYAFLNMKDLMARRRGRPIAYPVKVRRNPFTETEVRTVVREFKRKYGGQALGWAKDAASLQHRGSDAERMYSKVVVALRDGLYAHSNPKNDGSPTRGERHARRQQEYHRKHPVVARVDRRVADIEARMACVRDQLRATDDDATAERLTAELTALAASKRSNPARRRRR
jgi:hypothetical protein